VPCTDPRSDAIAPRRRALLLLPLLPAALSACSLTGSKSQTAAPPPPPAPVPTAGPAGGKPATAPRDAAPAPAPRAAPAPAPAGPLARNWEDYKRQAARRIVAANPEISHTGTVQQPSLAIPVLEVELAGDGSILRVEVLRPPREARHTVQIAVDAVRRAGPLPPVSHLPKPWKFTEAFLFNDDGRFKPSALNR
jgi:hypothetical protein